MNVFIYHFKKLSAASPTSEAPGQVDPESINHLSNEFINFPFSAAEVSQAVSKL
jgi:hypothetical protein